MLPGETRIEEWLLAADSQPEIVCLVHDNVTLVSVARDGIGFGDHAGTGRAGRP